MYIDALGLPYPMKALCDKIYAKALKLQECNGCADNSVGQGVRVM